MPRVPPTLVFLSLFVFSPAIAEEPAPPPISGKVLFSWTAVTTDTAGSPITVTGYELAIAPAASNLNTDPSKQLFLLPASALGNIETDGTALFLARPAADYVVQVRAVKDGIRSAWSDPLTVRLPFALVPPSRPIGLKVTLKLAMELQLDGGGVTSTASLAALLYPVGPAK